MNTKVSDARKKLFDLRKKYSAVNLQKYENTFGSSNESDSSDSRSVSKLVIDNESNIPDDREYRLSARTSLKSDSGETNDLKKVRSLTGLKIQPQIFESSFTETVNSESRIIYDQNKDAKQNSNSDISRKSCKTLVPGVNDCEDSKNIIRHSSVSDISSVRSCNLKNDDQSEIEEIFSDVERSSINDPFANVHLVSDDILEEIDSSIDSHSSIKEDVHTGRLSAVQSVKSLQLNSPIEPPKLEYDYESDFELSDDESEPFNSVTVSEGNCNDNKSTEIIVYDSLQDCTNIVEDNNSDKSLLNEKQSCLTTPKLMLYKNKVTPNNFKKLTVDDIEIEPVTSHSSAVSSVKTESCDKTVSSSPKALEFENKYIVSTYESEIIKTKLHDSDGIENLKDAIKLSETPVIINSGLLRELPPSHKRSRKNNSFCKTHKGKNSSSKIEKYQNGTGVNVKTIGVQTNDSRHTALYDKFGEINNAKFALGEKWYINTNVKGSKYRPIVKSSKLFKSSRNTDSSEFNPLLFTVQDKLPLDKLLDEILRNQIAMTKYFIDCHHDLYMQCCATVKSINKNYKKRQTPLLIT